MVTESVTDLVDVYQRAEQRGDLHMLAEVGHALAVRSRESGQLDDAKRYVHGSLRASEQLPSATLDDVANWRSTVGGVPIPDLLPRRSHPKPPG